MEYKKIMQRDNKEIKKAILNKIVKLKMLKIIILPL